MTMDLSFYKKLSGFRWPSSYSGKILLIAFVGTHIPLIVLFVFLTFFFPVEYRFVILLCVLLATLLGAGSTLYYIYRILEPVRLTGSSLNKYQKEKKMPDLPTHYSDDAGILMAQTQQCIEELDELLKLKNRLLSLVSHDSRTPLSTISLSTEMVGMELQSENPDIEEIKEFMRMIQVSTRQHLDYMNSMLSIARFDEGKLTIDKVEVRPDVILKELENNHKLYLEKKKISFTTESSLKDGDTLLIDKEKMMSVLNNLVQNSIKFTDEAGHIHVSIGHKNGKYLIDVKDDGVGISEKNQEGIFEAFSSSSKGTKKEKGTGLGLWIAQVFTELHDGSITLSSEEGEGTHISIAIPK